MSSLAGVSIRKMTPSDIATGLRLCRASRWNQTERDWRYFLTAAPDGALVATEGGAVIGTVATLPYGPFAWISMVLVEPSARGRGIGTMLLTKGLDLVTAGSTARLDATPAGEVIYRKLGFVPEYALTRFFLDARVAAPTRAPTARPLEPRDWPALLDIDRHAFGASRATLLEGFAAGAPEYAWVAEARGHVRGYVVGRHGHVREQIGPLVADSPETADALLGAVLASQPDRRMFIDVPDDQHAFRGRVAQLGFAVERPFLRMYRGWLTAPGDPSMVYAIAGPEFG
jgi:ribosomal protein S18 acetylase RimI-like enzyme